MNKKLHGNWRGGLPHCLDCNKQLSDYRANYCQKHAYLAERNPQWKGDKVQYTQLHAWVKVRFPKPELCENCKQVPPYDLANRGIYNRDLINWKWLCRKCHMVEDQRMIGFLSYTNAGKRGIENGNFKHGEYIK